MGLFALATDQEGSVRGTCRTMSYAPATPTREGLQDRIGPTVSGGRSRSDWTGSQPRTRGLVVPKVEKRLVIDRSARQGQGSDGLGAEQDGIGTDNNADRPVRRASGDLRQSPKAVGLTIPIRPLTP